MLLLCGSMSGPTADGMHAETALPTLPLVADTPLPVTVANPLPARTEPATAQVDDLPIVGEHDEAMTTSSPATPVFVRPAPASKASGPARFFTINEVLTKRNIGVEGKATIKLAAINPTTTLTDASPLGGPKDGIEPFGLFTFRAPEGLLWAKWRKVQVDITAEAPVLARCGAKPERCTPAAARFNAIVAGAKTRIGRARIQFVNEKINDAIRYASDMTQHGVPDLWSAPLDTLTTGLGDCEDYAIAKYVALRNAGVADSDLHLLLVRDKAVHMDHAVLAARDSGHWLILDNRWTRLVEDTDLRQFVALFALDEQGVKLFVEPFAASSQNDGSGAVTAGVDQDAILADPAPAAEADAGAPSWSTMPLLL
jgi:predicted transglutaminase-like cysteine proteinase